MTLLRWIGALAAVLATPAAGQDTLTLQPSGGWTLDYAEDNCALRRTFGGGESPAWLEIMQLAPGVMYRVTVSSSGLPMSRRRAPAVRFLPDGAESIYDLAAYGDYGEGFEGVAFYAMILSTTPEDVAQLEVVSTNGAVVASDVGTTGIEVRRAFDPPIVLQTGSLRQPLEAMRACMTDLVAQWGLGSAEGKLLSRPVARNMARWSRSIQDSFPRGLVQFDGPSRIKARVIVGPDGKPEKCRIIEPVVNEDYEQRTCGIILKDGEFEPARDAEGKPVRDIDVLNIVYLMSH